MKKTRDILAMLLIIFTIGWLTTGCSNTDTDTISEMVEKEVTQQLKNTKSGECYDGTEIPTYTSVTGVELFVQDTLEGGAQVYRYKYTDADDLGDYWENLVLLGWKEISGDDESTTTKLETAFGKNGKAVLVYLQLDFDEVWIIHS